MRAHVAKYSVIVVLVIVIATLAWDEIQSRRGSAQGAYDAQVDLGRRQLRYMAIGKPMYWESCYKDLLTTRYGIEHRRVAACCPGPFESAYARAYNDSIEPHLQARRIDLNSVITEAKSLAEARLHVADLPSNESRTD